MLRPVSGGCWGLRTAGALQWHGAYDPLSVETILPCDDGKDLLRVPLAYGLGKNLQGSAQNRVLCAV